ncbi:MAG TPA: hypothetical protein VFT62_10935 [Mycobacteriales bacterium]|nr:hypothetical protein [Mycobacteriales bacterium]
MRRGGRWALAVLVAAAVATGAVVGARSLVHHAVPPPPFCQVGAGSAGLILLPEQAANATTIAAVARRERLPLQAVTIALATALQESKLHNYPFGDRDSLGLFQQRPSQGWGRPAQLLTPSYAATAFFRHLVAVPHWRALPVAAAAQAVQRSADGTAYSQWEEPARAVARALTGRVPAGMTCQYTHVEPPRPAALTALAQRELGPQALGGVSGSSRDDWTVAEWLVAHAQPYGVVAVTVRAHRWEHASGRWVRDSSVGTAAHFVLARR